ncbi:potassium/sodium hyperpolarization-activated cyclic nucleotide-gated channel 1 [Tritrichomonas foetus]|uniref:Potassium/sodium hyperpolarization-activated cyclic nucleotide-gated channel 1 n=1 Tax=Tritrichomonas foetus TaxID=1144522 RepID=A0A1J4KP82_9EUKA|nr:potassium/sodium hyperpolarization-activated cyclic nucleotide-gated channel 1 [Tritrichomonas foetus]|eukprot:OHT13105.1 potassium/sodium hyperpolarization-activated cyclic nucleotide-gated channel 1 [Tritrichomonas foetus]
MQPGEENVPIPPPPPPIQQQTLQMPLFWQLLNDNDKEAYNRMRVALSSPACKHRRHHSNELNREIVNTIKSFVIRNDGEDWKRALVSGIAWLPNAIAINTRQLRLLLSKCKSSINALFQNMGYVTIPTTNDYSSSLINLFPLLRDNFTELRKWTIRLAQNPPAGLPQQIPLQTQNQTQQAPPQQPQIQQQTQQEPKPSVQQIESEIVNPMAPSEVIIKPENQATESATETIILTETVTEAEPQKVVVIENIESAIPQKVTFTQENEATNNQEQTPQNDEVQPDQNGEQAEASK